MAGRVMKVLGGILVVTVLTIILIVVGGVIWFQGGCWGRDKNFVREDSFLHSLSADAFDVGSVEEREFATAKIEASINQVLPLGSSVAEVEQHIATHFTISDPTRRKDWYVPGKWHYRFDIVINQECVSRSALTLQYTFEEEKLSTVSVSHSAASL